MGLFNYAEKVVHERKNSMTRKWRMLKAFGSGIIIALIGKIVFGGSFWLVLTPIIAVFVIEWADHAFGILKHAWVPKLYILIVILVSALGPLQNALGQAMPHAMHGWLQRTKATDVDLGQSLEPGIDPELDQKIHEADARITAARIKRILRRLEELARKQEEGTYTVKDEEEHQQLLVEYQGYKAKAKSEAKSDEKKVNKESEAEHQQNQIFQMKLRDPSLPLIKQKKSPDEVVLKMGSKLRVKFDLEIEASALTNTRERTVTLAERCQLDGFFFIPQATLLTARLSPAITLNGEQRIKIELIEISLNGISLSLLSTSLSPVSLHVGQQLEFTITKDVNIPVEFLPTVLDEVR